jgi:predicted transcriptional regulator
LKPRGESFRHRRGDAVEAQVMASMTKRLREALKQAETWPEEAQDELADAVLEIAESLGGAYRATKEELAGIDRGLDDARRRRFSSDEDVRAAFEKFRGP